MGMGLEARLRQGRAMKAVVLMVALGALMNCVVVLALPVESESWSSSPPSSGDLMMNADMSGGGQGGTVEGAVAEPVADIMPPVATLPGSPPLSEALSASATFADPPARTAPTAAGGWINAPAGGGGGGGGKALPNNIVVEPKHFNSDSNSGPTTAGMGMPTATHVSANGVAGKGAWADLFKSFGDTACKPGADTKLAEMSESLSVDACQHDCVASKCTAMLFTAERRCTLAYGPCDKYFSKGDLVAVNIDGTVTNPSPSPSPSSQPPAPASAEHAESHVAPKPAGEKVAEPVVAPPPPVATEADKSDKTMLAAAEAATSTTANAANKADPPNAGAPVPLPAIGSAEDTLMRSQPMINLTIVIPTVRRYHMDGSPAPEWYLYPLVTKMWSDLPREAWPFVHFIILNSDKEPEKHVEATSLASHPCCTVINKPDYRAMYGSFEDMLHKTGALTDDGRVYLEDGREVNRDWMSWVSAEDMDGAYLFEKAMTMSPYVLFLEDDVHPTRNALQKLTKFMQGFYKDDWFFIDLYTPNLEWAEGALDVRNAEPYNFFCCTQGMLFRSDMLPGVIKYWRTHANEPVDDNLKYYLRDSLPDHKIYAVRPNLVEHVGAYSSNWQKSTGFVEHVSLDFDEF